MSRGNSTKIRRAVFEHFADYDTRNVVEFISRLDRELIYSELLGEYRGFRVALDLQEENWFRGRVQALTTGPETIVTFSGDGAGFEVYEAAVKTAVDNIHARGVPQVPAVASVPSCGDRSTAWLDFRMPNRPE